jgi:hypothetical protein
MIVTKFSKVWNWCYHNPNGAMDDGKFELVILKNLDLVVLGKIISGNMPLDSVDVEIIYR